MRVVASAPLLLAFVAPAHATEWRLGLSYASGVSDVTDLYEDNLRLAGREADVDLQFPVGLAASFLYDWTAECAHGCRARSGVRDRRRREALGNAARHRRSATNSCRNVAYPPYVRGGLSIISRAATSIRQLHGRACFSPSAWTSRISRWSWPPTNRKWSSIACSATTAAPASSARRISIRTTCCQLLLALPSQPLTELPSRCDGFIPQGESAMVRIARHRLWLAAIAVAVLSACSNGRGSVSDPASPPVNEPPPAPPVPPPTPPPEPPPQPPPTPPPPVGAAMAGYWKGTATEEDSNRSTTRSR